MGFGFNLGMIYIVLLLTAILILVWIVSRETIVGILLGSMWAGLIGVVILSTILQPFVTKIELDQEDYYGEYVIDRSYFPGEQADWQYEHFRFEITEEDSILF